MNFQDRLIGSLGQECRAASWLQKFQSGILKRLQGTVEKYMSTKAPGNKLSEAECQWAFYRAHFTMRDILLFAARILREGVKSQTEGSSRRRDDVWLEARRQLLEGS